MTVTVLLPVSGHAAASVDPGKYMPRQLRLIRVHPGVHYRNGYTGTGAELMGLEDV